MKNNLIKLSIAAIFGLILFGSCNKHEDRPDPTMKFAFSIDDGYTSKDTTIASGDTVLIGLDCNWNGTDILKTLTLYLNNQYVNTFGVPTTISQSGLLTLKLIKTQLETDGWFFELVDNNGQRAYLGIALTKNNSGGQIFELTNITLGAQTNSGIGNFFATSNSTVYSLANAANNQPIIDFLLGYNATDKAYLASPSADLTGDYDLTSWTVKNNTLFCPTTRSSYEFSLIDSDLLLIGSFKEDQATAKATDLKAGKVYSFKTANRKFGLVNIISAPASAAGTSNFEIKIQQ